MELDAIPVAHTLKFLENELWSIVLDNYFRDAEFCDDIGLDKLEHCGSFDLGKGFSFGPLCVVFGCSQDEGFSL